ncbi:MAG: hypothetical protein J7545_21820, partial [Roseofilum sp. SBFL]
QRLSGEEPFWLPGINLGLGRAQGTYQGITREWLYWYNEQGERYLTPEEQLLSARQQIAQLTEKLRELGIDPSSLDS